MKKSLIKVLYRIVSFLSGYVNNRYLTKYKIWLGTSLLILMNVGPGCKRYGRITCYVQPMLPNDVVEQPMLSDSLEVMCYEVQGDLIDTADGDTLVHTPVKQQTEAAYEQKTVVKTLSQPKNSVPEFVEPEIEEDIMCYSPAPGYICPDVMPEFPGGVDALMSYIARSIRYPKIAEEKDIGGRVSVQFVVMQDGSIDSVKLYKSSDSIFNEEALRVIREMPKWSPGTCKGKPVVTKYTMPVNFRLPR